MQDGKRLVIAIILCLLVTIGWSYLGEKMGWVAKPDPQQIEQAQKEYDESQAKLKAAQDAAAQTAANPAPLYKESEGRDLVIDTPLYKATLYTGGGILRSFELKKYHTAVEANSPLVNMVNNQCAAVAPMGLLVNGQPSWSLASWTCDTSDDIVLDNGQSKTVSLRGEMGGMVVVREITFDAGTYALRENVRVLPAGNEGVSARIGYTVSADSSNANGGRYDVMRVGWDLDGGLKEEDSESTLGTTGVTATGKVYWGGAMSTYFLSSVMPGKADGVTFKARLNDNTQNGSVQASTGVADSSAQVNVYRVALEQSPVTIMPGTDANFPVTYWFGPKSRPDLEAVSLELAKSVDLGMFSLIAKGLLWLLEIFQSYVGNWGVAIILLTIAVKAIFWPLTGKSYSSMEKMKQLAPMMQAIKEKHKNDREAMNREVMALYKTYGVNPASGCIPILIQMPVFFGLYQALLTSVELRHAPFIATLPGTDLPWLADLSAADPYYITPLIMGASMLLMQKMSPPPADPKQAKMMMFLPVIFTFLFLSFPSGLVIYWLGNNVLSILQQWLQMRKNKRTGQSKAKAA